MWMYHSHINEIADVNAGLVGPMIITARGMAKADGTPKDVDRELIVAIDQEAYCFGRDVTRIRRAAFELEQRPVPAIPPPVEDPPAEVAGRAVTGVEALGNTRSFLDLTPLGRQEDWEDSPEGYPQTPPYQWWRRHDEHGRSAAVARWRWWIPRAPSCSRLHYSSMRPPTAPPRPAARDPGPRRPCRPVPCRPRTAA